MVFDSETKTLIARRYDIVSGAALSPITLQSEGKPHLWAHGKSFRVMTTAQDGENCIINIFEIGVTLTRIESFHIHLGGGDWQIESFSPITYRISVNTGGRMRILVFDIRNSGCLLNEEGNGPDCFSSNGGLFAASQLRYRIGTWKYDNGRYIQWRQFSTPAGLASNLQFSPTSSSILADFRETLKLWHLDGSYVDSTARSMRFDIPSRSGTYLATARKWGCVVRITNLLSQTPSQVIDTDLKIWGLILVGNILLVEGERVITAWLLTEEGLVNGVFGARRAGRGDSIWSVSKPHSSLSFSVEGETGIIKCNGNVLHVCNTDTGEVLEPAVTLLHLNGPWYPLTNTWQALHYLYDGDMGGTPPGDSWEPLQTTLKEGWIKDREGRHLLWLPVEWRAVDWNEVEWFSNIATIRFVTPECGNIIAKLY